MKKVININFQGRVIPIEETAYELLKQYIESLRRYFANEEGRDEIINDIEGRIAELFSERIKKGATCITDDDVNAVIASMGRPEDFEAETAGTETNNTQQQQQQSYQSHTSSSSQSYGTYNRPGRGRLYRNADDKILGGVASGLANYFGIDPVIMRIIFVVLFAPLFWVYILLWVIIPSQSIETNITKRLYRSADDKVISGVCGGLAAYFNTPNWVPRLIFALPLIFGLISGVFNNFWWHDWDFWWGPKIITSSLGSTLFLTYIILWITVPIAVTSAEKLEMRGEKVDLNSIRDTVKEDLEGFKVRAEKWGKEVKESAQQWGEKAKEFGQTAGSRAKTFSAEAGPAARHAGSGVGHAIGVIFKAFFMFIFAIILICLITVAAAFIFGGFTVFPVKDFLLDGFGQNMLAWATLILFLGIPLIALLTWLVRRIMGVRSKSHSLRYVFSTLWFAGLICAFILGMMITRDFKSAGYAPEEEIQLKQPAGGRLIVDVAETFDKYYGEDWYGIDWEEWPFYAINQDTVMLNTVRVNFKKSEDANFHIRRVKFSRGSNLNDARDLAGRITFNVEQQDSVLLLPKGFAISRNEKFRNQQVLVIVEIPVGKRIRIDSKVENYEWFSINVNRRRGYRNNDFDWDNSYGWSSDKDLIMTPEDGLQPEDKYEEKELKAGKFKLKIKDGDNELNIEGELKDTQSQPKTDTTEGYRYRRNKGTEAVDTAGPVKKADSRTTYRPESADEETATGSRKPLLADLAGPVASLARLF